MAISKNQPRDLASRGALEALSQHVGLTIEGRRVLVRAWRYLIQGVTGHTVLVYFLETDLPENDPDDRALTGRPSLRG